MSTVICKGLLTSLLVVSLLLSGCALMPEESPRTPSSEKMSQQLATDIQNLKQMSDEQGMVTAVIKLEGASLYDVRQESMVEELKRHSSDSQKEVLQFLERNGATVLNTFWLTNAILAELPVSILDELPSHANVERVFQNFSIELPEPLKDEASTEAFSADHTWGLERLGAPDVWNTLNVTGSGIRVAVLDTGVDISHPDLIGKMWTDDPDDPTYPGGWIEFDLAGNIVAGSVPHDTVGHGTHCSGTVLGADASGVAIGVAPDATLMHALTMPYGGGSFAIVIAALQWAMKPVDQYGEPAGTAAHVVSLSGGHYAFVNEFLEPIQNMRAAGVVPIFSIGNEGVNTSGSPGNVYDAFGIGATDIDDEIAWWSSGEEIYWPASHPDPYIKPDFGAPGVSVYSSVPWGYTYFSGTSMASPHVAGTVALMLNANPGLTVDEIHEILKDTAVWYDYYQTEQPCTRYGWGRIDASNAVSLAMLESGIEGYVTDADTGDPLKGARVSVSGTGQVRSTDESGYYRFFLPAGSYNLTSSMFGYYERSIEIEVVDDLFTSQSFPMELLPTGFIAGDVTDSETTLPIEGAVITILGTTLRTETSAEGQYSIEAPIGTYDVRARARGYRPDIVSDVNVQADDTVLVDFALDTVLATIAVLGDYQAQLTYLLMANGFWAEERGWDALDDLGNYDVVVVNHPPDPGESAFLSFLDAASNNKVGIVFTSSFPGSLESYGISLLERHLGDPAGQWFDVFAGDVYYKLGEPHPLFDGWDQGDEITIITGGARDHAWFFGYSGYTVADIGSQQGGVRGNAVSLNAYGDSLHVLLAGLAPHPDTNVPHWTSDATEILFRGILAAAGLIELDLVVATAKLPAGVLAHEYTAPLNAIGGTKPYAWNITDGDLPPGLDLCSETGGIWGTPTEAGTFHFNVQVTDATEATATRDLSLSIISFTEFITDPEGDQFHGYGPDIVGIDYDRDENAIYFRIRTAEPIDPYDTVNYMWLDLDLDPSTGFVSPDPDMPTNDIGADAAALIIPGYLYGAVAEELPLPLRSASTKPPTANTMTSASSPLQGLLLRWDHHYGWFDLAGMFHVFLDTDEMWFAIDLDMLDDDGIMSVVNVIGNSWESTDVAPNEGHGITGEGPDLVISAKWEEWTDEHEETYIVHYVVKNRGNAVAPADHETALRVDGQLLETNPVPVALAPGEEYQGSFDTIVTISPATDTITVCADLYNIVDELSEANNCHTNVLIPETAWHQLIGDPVGDQFHGYGPDIVGVDFHVDDDIIRFRVRTAQPIDPTSIASLMWLDLDMNPFTGYRSTHPDMPTNDMGADAAALIGTTYLPLPLNQIAKERQPEAQQAPGSSGTTQGTLLLWDPYFRWFDSAGSFDVFLDTDCFWFAIPLDLLDDDGIMGVVNIIGLVDFPFPEFTDVAPNQGHGVTVPLEILISELLDGRYGVAYGAYPDVEGGAPPYTWDIVDGALPGGLELDDAHGVIRGFPSEAGTFDFTLRVMDAVGAAASARLSITIAPMERDGCLIATATYGTDSAIEIDILREFRDTVLLPDPVGAGLVSLYYRTSPPLAALISEHEFLRTLARVGFVDRIVSIVNRTHNLWSYTG